MVLGGVAAIFFGVSAEGKSLVLQQRPGVPVVAMPGMSVLAGRPRTPADGRFSAETAIFVSDMSRFAVHRHHWG
jgi:hypothetical protein